MNSKFIALILTRKNYLFSIITEEIIILINYVDFVVFIKRVNLISHC